MVIHTGLNRDTSWTKLLENINYALLSLWKKPMGICKNRNHPLSTFFWLGVDLRDIWWIFHSENPRINIRWENLWIYLFLKPHYFSDEFSIILAFTAHWAVKKEEMRAFWKKKKMSSKNVPKLSKLYRNDMFVCQFVQLFSIFYEFFWHFINGAISLFFIARQAVKARIIEN